jgi:hypothetical protein
VNHAMKMFGVAIVLGLAFVAPAHADECKHVDFTLQNDKIVEIRALSMDYLFSNDNQWRNEQFANVDVPRNSFRKIAWDQNLAGGEGNEMIAMRLHFKAHCTSGWTGELISVEDTAFTDTSDCVSFSGREYRLDLPSSDVCNP